MARSHLLSHRQKKILFREIDRVLLWLKVTSQLSAHFEMVLISTFRLCPAWSGQSTRIWATPCDFQQCGILTSVDSDEPVHLPFKLRNSKWCSFSSLTLIKYSCDWQMLWPDCAYAQADLSFWLVAHTTLMEISCRGSIIQASVVEHSVCLTISSI